MDHHSCFYHKNLASDLTSKNVSDCVKSTLASHTVDKYLLKIPLKNINISDYLTYIESYYASNLDNNRDILVNILCLFLKKYIVSSNFENSEFDFSKILHFITQKISNYADLSYPNIQPQFLCVLKTLENINAPQLNVRIEKNNIEYL